MKQKFLTGWIMKAFQHPPPTLFVRNPITTECNMEPHQVSHPIHDHKVGSLFLEVAQDKNKTWFGTCAFFREQSGDCIIIVRS